MLHCELVVTELHSSCTVSTLDAALPNNQQPTDQRLSATDDSSRPGRVLRIELAHEYNNLSFMPCIDVNAVIAVPFQLLQNGLGTKV